MISWFQITYTNTPCLNKTFFCFWNCLKLLRGIWPELALYSSLSSSTFVSMPVASCSCYINVACSYINVLYIQIGVNFRDITLRQILLELMVVAWVTTIIRPHRIICRSQRQSHKGYWRCKTEDLVIVYSATPQPHKVSSVPLPCIKKNSTSDSVV